MNNYKHLPTWISGTWSVASFLDSLISTLKADRSCETLTMYFYAVTQSGWDRVRKHVLKWKSEIEGRDVILFVGTDHGITDPSALRQICNDGVQVRLMLKYHGVFHPKVVWLYGRRRHVVWVGSNNLTRDGLLNNVEFAMLVKAKKIPRTFSRWTKAVETASTMLTQDLLNSYNNQRAKFQVKRAQVASTTFTWEKKIETQIQPPVFPVNSDNLIVEVMPRETGGDGKQLQLPVTAASRFFGLTGIGASKIIELRPKDGLTTREHTMTIFGNNTVRIVVADLEYRDRPCVIVFRKVSKNCFEYEIVPQSIFPSRYKALLRLCTNKTRHKSRRWGIV